MRFVLKVTVAIALVGWCFLSLPMAVALHTSLFLTWLCGWLLILGVVGICEGTWIIVSEWVSSSRREPSR